jgi:hypothetical protein
MDKAGDLLKAFFAFHNLEGGEKYVSLFSSWRKVAGDDIASHSRIVDLRRGALLVEVDHPGWMQMLQMKQEAILKTLALRYPDLAIRMLHVKLTPAGQFSSPTAVPANPAPLPEPAAETPAEPPVSKTEQEALDAIYDENLKNTLLRLQKTLKKKGRGYKK